MPSPCSLRLGVVRSDHATEVQALRPSRLALAAGEIWKIAGASRRSAAPGSQSVGVAEYGDDLRTFHRRQVLGRKPEITAHTVICASPITPVLSLVQPRAAARYRAGRATLNALHARGCVQAQGRETLRRAASQRFRLRYPCANPASPQHQPRSVAPENLLLNPQNATTQRNGG
jgi:hypothetical protein